MTQQTSPFIEAKYGWNYGESGWNSGMDENLTKFSFLFDKNIDGIVSSLPSVVNGTAYFLTTDNRIYFGVSGAWYSVPTPKWFTLILRSTGSSYQFSGTSLVAIANNSDLSSQVQAIQVTLSSLGTASLKDAEYFASASQLDIASAQANNYTDTLRTDLGATNQSTKGAGQVGYLPATVYTGDTVGAALSSFRATTGSTLIGFKASGTDTGANTVFNKLSNYVDITDFLKFYGPGPYTQAQNLAACTMAWNQALLVGKDIYAAAGVYEIGENNFPWRQSIVTSLLDCKNITIFGDGPNTIFRTNSVAGADVFQLNGLKNFHVRNLSIEALVSGSASGSNGVSVTNGWENITLDHLWIRNLGSVDKTTFIDGGKAVTLQSDGATENCGSFTAKNIYAIGCSQGFGFESNLVNFLTKTVNVDVQLIAENCFVGATLGAAAASGAIPPGTHNGVKVNLTAINCQKDLVLARVHGGSYTVDVVTTKTEAARRLSPLGVAWYAADTTVESLFCTYAKNAQISVSGNKGNCAQKVRIGGASTGSSGLNSATEFCDIYLDIKGTTSVADIVEVSVSGNTVRQSTLYSTPTTTSSYPSEISLAANLNTLSVGPNQRLSSPTAMTKLGLNFTSSGTFESGKLALFDTTVVGVKGGMSSTPRELVVGLYDTNDFPCLQVGVGGRLKLSTGVPIYADNTAATAAGLAVGDVYRTSTGVIMFRF